MKNVNLVWQCTYAHDRRAHRHRCKACRRVLEAGDDAMMCRTGARKTIAIHAACADVPHPCGTWLDALKEWAFESLLLGTSLNRFNPCDFAAVANLRATCGLDNDHGR